MTRSRSVYALVLAVELLPLAAASAQERIVVAIRSTGESDAALVERIRGQTVDLPITIEERSSEPLSEDATRNLAFARTLAAESAANAVVWFDREVPTVVTIHVLVPAHRRIFTRSMVGSGESAQAGTALMEGAALILRGVLRAVVEGRPVGDPEPPAALPARFEDTTPPASASPASASPASTPPELETATGFRFGWPGAPAPSVVGRLRLSLNFVRIGLSAALGFPREVPDDRATLRLTRHGFGLELGAGSGVGEQLEIGAYTRIGAAVILRQTRNPAEQVEPFGDTWHLSALLGAGATLAWSPIPVLSLQLDLGLDLLTAPVRVQFDLGDRRAAIHDVHRYEPWISLGLAVRWSKIMGL